MEVKIRLVLLDLSVAFDTVDLYILTDTLNVSWHLWVRYGLVLFLSLSRELVSLCC